MSEISWIQAASTIFLGLVGLWLAQNYRRQVRLKLADRQADSYLCLWKLTALATPERTTPLSDVECQELRDRMNHWYHDDGNGIFMSPTTRDLFLGLRSNLVCPIGSMKPTVLGTELATLPKDEAERRRGCIVIRQASLLRTQLKNDVSMHFGLATYSDLRPEDRAFLRSCGISTWRRPWRSKLFGPSVPPRHHACLCDMCPSITETGSPGSP